MRLMPSSTRISVQTRSRCAKRIFHDSGTPTSLTDAQQEARSKRYLLPLLVVQLAAEQTANGPLADLLPTGHTGIPATVRDMVRTIEGLQASSAHEQVLMIVHVEDTIIGARLRTAMVRLGAMAGRDPLRRMLEKDAIHRLTRLVMAALQTVDLDTLTSTYLRTVIMMHHELEMTEDHATQTTGLAMDAVDPKTLATLGKGSEMTVQIAAAVSATEIARAILGASHVSDATTEHDPAAQSGETGIGTGTGTFIEDRTPGLQSRHHTRRKRQ